MTSIFRGKCRHIEEWIEGFLFHKTEECDVAICISKEPLSANDYSEILGDWSEVIPETVGRYTGKDIGEEKLFEGDIVESYEDYDDKFGYPTTSHFYSVVIWDEENFCWAFKTDDYIQAFNDWTWDNTMKVGNIHDNPELLKGGVTE